MVYNWINKQLLLKSILPTNLWLKSFLSSHQTVKRWRTRRLVREEASLQRTNKLNWPLRDKSNTWGSSSKKMMSITIYCAKTTSTNTKNHISVPTKTMSRDNTIPSEMITFGSSRIVEKYLLSLSRERGKPTWSKQPSESQTSLKKLETLFWRHHNNRTDRIGDEFS